MQNENELIWIVALTISGLMFFDSLTKSMKAIRKLPRIGYLIVAVICGAVVMESVARLTNQWAGPGFLQDLATGLIRVVQVLWGLIGVLMVIGIAIRKKEIGTAV